MEQKTQEQISSEIFNSYEDGPIVTNDPQLPSRFYPKQVVNVKFKKDQQPMTATVRAVHFYTGKVKYDVDLWLDGDQETRIYNIDSKFVLSIDQNISKP